MDQYTLQMYFTEECKQHFRALTKRRKIEKEIDELQEKSPKETIEQLEELLSLYLSEELEIKYFGKRLCKEEIKEEIKNLKGPLSDSDKKIKELNDEVEFWKKREDASYNEIFKTISEVYSSGYELIVSIEEEVIALIVYCHFIGNTGVVNISEQYLSHFPYDNPICKKFMSAYMSKDQVTLDNLYEEYCE